ncbi:hypothetical protein [Nocardia inohanensis]|uniref:hypothetical protein n=1 Tax=Nocardia inohanensis TaxID=209246 RepID=UPI000832A5E1|nr:hypothetical protein [Nocardia inohanensis]
MHIDFGSGPRHPTISYTAPEHVIARFAPALRQWNPDFRVQVESFAADAENLPPGLPTWRLFAWDEPDPPRGIASA